MNLFKKVKCGCCGDKQYKSSMFTIVLKAADGDLPVLLCKSCTEYLEALNKDVRREAGSR